MEKTAPASPYSVALVRRTASSMLATGLIARVGPKVSSVISVESSGTCVRIVGCTKRSPTASEPPSATLAPLAIASSMWLLMTSSCDGMVIGPIFAPESAPARRPLAWPRISVMKASKTFWWT